MQQVLIVDDELPLLRNLSSYLAAFPEEFTVRTAFSAEDALILIRQEPSIDTVLTDVRMPGMDGIHLIRSAASLRPGLQFLVMTAYPSREIRRAAEAAGALRYLEKPLDVNELRAVLNEMHATRQGWSGSIEGLDIFDFTQLFAMSGKTTAIRVRSGENEGVLAFRNGRLVHASSGGLAGEAAFLHLTRHRGGTFQELPRQVVDGCTPNISSATNHLMIEAARLRDEEHRAAGEGDETVSGERQPVPRPRPRADGVDEYSTAWGTARTVGDPTAARGVVGVGCEAAGIAQLFRIACDERRPVRVLVRLDEHEAELFFAGGALVHARMGRQTGEEVVYAVLTWDQSVADFEVGVTSSETTITKEWSDLFLRAFAAPAGAVVTT